MITTTTVFVFLLATKVYSGLGILLGSSDVDAVPWVDRPADYQGC
jgi:hypothetical protein